MAHHPLPRVMHPKNTKTPGLYGAGVLVCLFLICEVFWLRGRERTETCNYVCVSARSLTPLQASNGEPRLRTHKIHSQKITAAAMQMLEKKVCAQRS